jgi:hypothetical protein
MVSGIYAAIVNEILVSRFIVFTEMAMKNAVFWDWRRVALVTIKVSEEISIIRVKRISDVGRTFAVTSTLFLAHRFFSPR